MAEERIKISLDKTRVELEIAGAEFYVEEMDGPLLAEWRKTMSEKAKFDGKGNFVGLKSYTGAEAELISRCLFKKDGTPVEKNVIINWPVSAQQKLLKLCQEINGLTETAEEDAKKG